MYDNVYKVKDCIDKACKDKIFLEKFIEDGYNQDNFKGYILIPENNGYSIVKDALKVYDFASITKAYLYDLDVIGSGFYVIDNAPDTFVADSVFDYCFDLLDRFCPRVKGKYIWSDPIKTPACAWYSKELKELTESVIHTEFDYHCFDMIRWYKYEGKSTIDIYSFGYGVEPCVKTISSNNDVYADFSKSLNSVLNGNYNIERLYAKLEEVLNITLKGIDLIDEIYFVLGVDNDLSNKIVRVNSNNNLVLTVY